jgi:hypothetical protein
MNEIPALALIELPCSLSKPLTMAKMTVTALVAVNRILLLPNRSTVKEPYELECQFGMIAMVAGCTDGQSCVQDDAGCVSNRKMLAIDIPRPISPPILD